ncbi:sensor histidine kinase [Nocardioides massiliensis]|uniref:Signal transduction histidine kinase n=1 Tax=Nocardioides massiliensis TaxID=1325935 RepID=A0ABT9NT22_9ACTN|nr:histidine kinase [Nocardioides massiliensis]MDP9823564.1 signal transduction histidine kinase [Nocardioides massiliensis]
MNVQRITAAARAFGLALMLGLALLTPGAGVFQTLILGTALAAAGLMLEAAPQLRSRIVALGEGTGAALLVGSTMVNADTMLPYLAAMAFVAGVHGGWRWSIATVVSEAAALLLMTSIAGTVGEAAFWRSAITWIAVGAGLGVVGAQLRAQAKVHGQVDASYRDARALLAQLRDLSSRLTDGLDPISVTDRIMGKATDRLDALHCAVIIRGDADSAPLPLSFSSREASEALTDIDSLVRRCIKTGNMVNRGRRQALPLRADDRVVGVLVVDCEEPPAGHAVAAVVRELAPEALRLDTALLFDSVRSEATAEERQRLAREVHDGIAQDVASLGYLVDDLLFAEDEDERIERIRELRGELTRVVAELRLSVFDLRNRVESTEGLGSALSAFARQIGSRSDLTVHLTLDEAPHRLRPDVEQELLRIAQEAMNNARKHSGGHNLWVRCTVYPPYAEIVVRDDGHGLGEGRADSHGLRIMQERAARIGADLELSDGGQMRGTTLSVRLDASHDHPYSQPQAAGSVTVLRPEHEEVS